MLGLGLLAGIAAASMLPGAQDWFAPTLRGSGGSMSHGPEPQPGVLDHGDLGNYQSGITGPEQVTTTLQAREEGRAPIAGDLGDVLIFRPNGAPSGGLTGRPLIEHRALAWVAYDAATGLFDVPELGLNDVRELPLASINAWDAERGAYLARDFVLTLVAESAEGARTYPAGQHSGWVTKGDHNDALDQQPGADGAVLSALVQPAWVSGKLTRVVDQDVISRDVLVGVVVAILLGVGALLLRAMLTGKGLGWSRSKQQAGQQGFVEPAYEAPREPSMPAKLLKALRASCESCGTPFAELAFCMRCGADRHPTHRYGSTEARQAAARGARRR